MNQQKSFDELINELYGSIAETSTVSDFTEILRAEAELQLMAARRAGDSRMAAACERRLNVLEAMATELNCK